MRIQAALLATDPVFQHWLADAVESSVDLHLVPPQDSPAASVEELGRHPRLALIFVHVEPGQHYEDLFEAIAAQWPSAPIVALGSEASSELVIEVMRAGARDFLIWGRDDRELRPRLQKLLNKIGGAGARGDHNARVVALLNGVPDHGLAWAAVHLALLATANARAGERVLLIDAATPCGAAPVFLNASQSYSLLDGLRDLDRCDQTLVDTAFTRHGSGLFVLSLPEDLIGSPDIDPVEFLDLIEILGGFFQQVYVAAGTNLPLAALAGLLRRAHAGLFVSNPSILNSRANKHVLRALRLEGSRFERTGLVVDQPGSTTGLEPENLAELLELPLWGCLGGSLAQRQQAMDAGESLLARAPRDPYCIAIGQLAERLRADNPAALGTAVARRRGLLSRLLGS